MAWQLCEKQLTRSSTQDCKQQASCPGQPHPCRCLPCIVLCQAIALAKRPHVIVGTPGRVVDHLSNTKGFSLKALKHLVLDEADKLLDMDFEQEIDQILKVGLSLLLFMAVNTTLGPRGEQAYSSSPSIYELSARTRER